MLPDRIRESGKVVLGKSVDKESDGKFGAVKEATDLNRNLT
jgi:hypothetical protein